MTRRRNHQPGEPGLQRSLNKAHGAIRTTATITDIKTRASTKRLLHAAAEIVEWMELFAVDPNNCGLIFSLDGLEVQEGLSLSERLEAAGSPGGLTVSRSGGLALDDVKPFVAVSPWSKLYRRRFLGLGLINQVLPSWMGQAAGG